MTSTLFFFLYGAFHGFFCLEVRAIEDQGSERERERERTASFQRQTRHDDSNHYMIRKIHQTARSTAAASHPAEKFFEAHVQVQNKLEPPHEFWTGFIEIKTNIGDIKPARSPKRKEVGPDQSEGDSCIFLS